MPLMQLLIIVRTVLDPSVGVMEQALSALTPSQCHFQSLCDLFGLQTRMYVPAHDLARVCVGYQA